MTVTAAGVRIITQVPVPPTSQLVVTAAAASAATAATQAGISTAQAAIATTQATNAAASTASIRVDAATFATIPTLTTSCFVFVAVDETNDNQPTVYFFDGTNLNWLPIVGV